VRVVDTAGFVSDGRAYAATMTMSCTTIAIAASNVGSSLIMPVA
jgi:hypothetical protein